ncbi:MAG: hypothetical protein LBH09_08370 [Peptococcaceae bacterium]|nr:hypothetical protein [Peptococcaceae bacterium]
MKKSRLFKAFACLLSVLLMSSVVGGSVIGSANSAQISFLNPLADVEPQRNQPLAERLETFEGKTIAIASYSKAANQEACWALGRMLEAEYGILSEENPYGVRVIYDQPALGGPWNQKSEANYNTWASADAVIFGVAD